MYLVFDCETSGLDPNCNNLLTCCFIVLNSELESVDKLTLDLKYDSYCVVPRALEVNNINLIEHQKKSLFLEEARTKLLYFLDKNKNRYRFIPVGHNINFDIGFIKSSGLLTNEEYNSYCSINPIDTLVISQFLKTTGYIKRTSSLSLGNLAKMFFTDELNKTDRLHTCDYDTELTVKLFKHYVDYFLIVKNKNKNSNNNSVSSSSDQEIVAGIKRKRTQ